MNIEQVFIEWHAIKENINKILINLLNVIIPEICYFVLICINSFFEKDALFVFKSVIS